ncbi:DUF4326 domain-containing protein [Maricaulis sp.]|uniref:DUF4326 domain-containing protein n=1 Tax=Maricaulis sp. TaxID=1486257 RepID=UPI003299A826
MPRARRKPQRIQLKRTKGFRKPKEAVTVTRATRWGNPYRVDEWGRQRAVSRFREDLYERGVVEGPRGPVTVEMIRAELKGRDLACFCDHHGACHGDVLMAIANSRGPLKRKRSVTGGMGVGAKPSLAAAHPDGDCRARDHRGDPLPTRWDFVLDEVAT